MNIGVAKNVFSVGCTRCFGIAIDDITLRSRPLAREENIEAPAAAQVDDRLALRVLVSMVAAWSVHRGACTSDRLAIKSGLLQPSDVSCGL